MVTAKAAILIDRHTQEILWQHNPDLPLPPASTTKIVTAMLALQSGQLDESFAVTDNAAQEPPSKIALRTGWEVRLRDLVYAILLNSANDASVVIAEGLADSVRSFAARMNVHAYALGASNTHFVNPNGLPADDHYTSARDLALLFSAGLKNPAFREVLETRATTIVPTAGSKRPIALHTKNRLLTGYPIHVIGKTGWTRAAGKCFVGSGTVGDREVIVAVLGSDNLWVDLRRLLEFGFGQTTAPLPRSQPQTTIAAAPPVNEHGAGDADDTRYFVRLATFSSRAQADGLQRTVQNRGYPTRVVQVHQNRKLMYQVTVGSYADRKTAEKALRAIRRSHPDLRPLIVGT